MNNQISIISQLDSIVQSFSGFYPELALACLFILLILTDLIFRKQAAKLLPFVTIVGLLVTFYLLLNQNCTTAQTHGRFLFFKSLHLDQYEVFFKLIFVLSALLFLWFLLISSYYKKEGEKLKGEFYAIFIALILGLNLMVMSSNLLMIYLSIELVSISSYILTTFAFDRKSSEAGLKYVLFGAFSSGLMLYGMSLLYGFTGSLQFSEPEFLNQLQQGNHIMVTVACFLVLSGFLFKIAAIPFQVWAPDVYEAAPTPIVAFFSVAPKAAGIALLINFTYPFYLSSAGETSIELKYFIGIIAIATLTIGNLAALGQNNIKRILAYSSIAHAGFILVALLAFSKFGIWSVLFYISVYLVMNFAAFALVDFISGKIESEDVRNFKGLGGKLPIAGVIFVLVMVALTGLPPTAGFNAKLLAFSAIWEAYQESGEKILLWTFIAGLLNTVISLFYYLKVPYYMYFKQAENNTQIKLFASENMFLCLMSIPILVLFFKPDWLMDQLQKIILNF